MVKINREEFDDAMEHLHKAKKYLKKACELMHEGEDGSRGRGRMNRRHDTSRFDDDEEDYD